MAEDSAHRYHYSYRHCHHLRRDLVYGHLKELTKEATVRKFRTVQMEGSRTVEREVEQYNLDMIISLGYRIRSIIATRFRQWATERLKEYIIKMKLKYYYY